MANIMLSRFVGKIAKFSTSYFKHGVALARCVCLCLFNDNVNYRETSASRSAGLMGGGANCSQKDSLAPPKTLSENRDTFLEILHETWNATPDHIKHSESAQLWRASQRANADLSKLVNEIVVNPSGATTQTLLVCEQQDICILIPSLQLSFQPAAADLETMAALDEAGRNACQVLKEAILKTIESLSPNFQKDMQTRFPDYSFQIKMEVLDGVLRPLL